MAEGLAQFAPCDQDANVFEEAKCDRPNYALGDVILDVDIAQVDAAFRADGGADFAEVKSRLGRVPARRDQQAGRFDLVGQVFGQNSDDLGQGILGRFAQPGVSPVGDPVGPKHQGLQLLTRQHKWRQHIAGPQDIPDTRLALDMGPLGLQGGNIAVEGTQGYLKLARQFRAGDGVAVAAKELQQIQQTGGTRHDDMASGIVAPCLAQPSANSCQHIGRIVEKPQVLTLLTNGYILVGMAISFVKTKDTRRRNPVATREKLLSAAFEEIYRSGFQGADLSAIIARSGVTKGALYHHFDNKDALGHAVIDEVVAGLIRDQWLTPLENADNAVDALIQTVKAIPLSPESIAGGCPLNNLAQEMSPLDEGFRRRLAAIFKGWIVGLGEALHTGQVQGAVRKGVNPFEVASQIVAMYEGYVSLAKNAQDAEFLALGIAQMTRFLEGLRPVSDGQRERISFK